MCVMRRIIKIQSKKVDSKRQSYYITVPEGIMNQLHNLKWKEGETELIPKVEINETGEVALIYSAKSKK